MPDYATQRRNMVEAQVRTSDVLAPQILAAMLEVPREQFVPSAKRPVAYAEADIEVVRGRFLLAPRLFGKLLQVAEIRPTDTVLDVACATGYSTAVLARLAHAVAALEQDVDLVRVATETLSAVKNASVVQGAFVDGYGPKAPYDVIFINGAVEWMPDALLGQIKDGGRLVVVQREGALSRALVYSRDHGRVGHRVAFDAHAPLIPGFRESVGFVF